MNIIKNPTKHQIDEIIAQLKDGKIIVYPTDTIYGIGANIYDTQAVRKVYNIKQRDHTKPLSIIVHNTDQIKQITKTNKTIDKILETYLPGAYTFILPKKDIISDSITANKKTVGIRIPKNKITYNLTQDFPITTTSANISNMPTPRSICEISKYFKDEISTYIDMGISQSSEPSTIVDLTNKYPKIIRQSKTDNKIEDILDIKLR